MEPLVRKPEEKEVQVLRDCPLFGSLPPADVKEFATHTEVQAFEPGAVVCARGTSGEKFYVVTEGTVQITVPTSSARTAQGAGQEAVEAVVRVAKRGEFFGEIACLVEKGTRTANVRTREGCTLLSVPRDQFLRLVQSHPPAAMALVRFLADRVRYHTDALARLIRPDDYEHLEDQHHSLWHKMADGASAWSAHWSFIVLNLLLWVVWLAANGKQLVKDLPTINGLTMWVSLQAIIMTTFVLVAQERANAKEKRRKELQFQWAAATMERINQVSARLANVETTIAAAPSTLPPRLAPPGP